MAGNFKDLHLQAQKIMRSRFLHKKVGLGWFDFQSEPEFSEKFAVGNHRCGQRVTPDLAAKALLNFRNVLDMIDMSVGEEQKRQTNLARFEPFAGTLRCV